MHTGTEHTGKPCPLAGESMLESIRSRFWLALFTRPCPRCKRSIERDGGCLHMTCLCGHEICWSCGTDYVKVPRSQACCCADSSRSQNGRRGHNFNLFPSRNEFQYCCNDWKQWSLRVLAVAVGSASVAVTTVAVFGFYTATTAFHPTLLVPSPFPEPTLRRFRSRDDWRDPFARFGTLLGFTSALSLMVTGVGGAWIVYNLAWVQAPPVVSRAPFTRHHKRRHVDFFYRSVLPVVMGALTPVIATGALVGCGVVLARKVLDQRQARAARSLPV
jgi:hypothetical protein